MDGSLPGLRDIHLPAPPGWWPPAPGWWVLAGAIVVALLLAWRFFRTRPIARGTPVDAALAEFDAELARAGSAPSRLAAASAQLRRAARQRDPAAAVLEGQAWLRFLDGDDPARSFSEGPGALLVDGAFRRRVDDDLDATIALARRRFASLLDPAPREPADA